MQTELPRYPHGQSRTCYQECVCHWFQVENFTWRKYTLTLLDNIWGESTRVPAGIIEHLRFEVRLAQKVLAWQDLCTRRFSQDSLVITAWIWCLPKIQGLRVEVGGGGNY